MLAIDRSMRDEAEVTERNMRLTAQDGSNLLLGPKHNKREPFLTIQNLMRYRQQDRIIRVNWLALHLFFSFSFYPIKVNRLPT